MRKKTRRADRTKNLRAMFGGTLKEKSRSFTKRGPGRMPYNRS